MGKSETEDIALKMELEKLKSVIKASKLSEKVDWKDFCSQTAIRGMIIGMAMAWFLQMTGKKKHSFSTLSIRRKQPDLNFQN